MSAFSLVCPVRGILKSTGKSADGLTPNEEYHRVQAIKHLIDKGYPAECFKVEVIEKRFGNGGRNSFRCDFAVFDQPVSNLSNCSIDELLKHALLLCEVKRDSSRSDYVQSTQVEPMLSFAKRESAIGLFWSEDAKRLFWYETENDVKVLREAPLAALPHYGERPEVKPLTFGDLLPCPSMLDAFSKIEDILHGFGLSKEERYEAIFQLLLAKLFDEHAFETRPDERLELQDYGALGYNQVSAAEALKDMVLRGVNHYQNHLPKEIPTEMTMPDEAVIDVMKVLAPFKIIASKRDVVQTFYMKFAKDLYKWDMAQYFTPTKISDFFVDIANPQFGDQVCDPACGSADFLVGAFRYGKRYNPGYADSIFGYDNSQNAVQVAVLNMVLNGDGKSNIHVLDSLKCVSDLQNRFDLMICNPPFGSKITEKREKVLSEFELGRGVSTDGKTLTIGEKALGKQEAGLLFVEVCMKACRRTGGRIAIVLPNGYLGNTGPKFKAFRDWLLCRASIASIVSLPRFAFKSSGADVSASIVFMETRNEPLRSPLEASGELINFELVEKLGWEAGTSKQNPVFVREPSSGALKINEGGEKIVDCDFDKVLADILNSPVVHKHKWLLKGRENMFSDGSDWAISSDLILADGDHSLDPKYWCRKNQEHIEQIKSSNHFALGELVDFIPEKQNLDGSVAKKGASTTYGYVDIRHMANGVYQPEWQYGWELPARARHFAAPRDIFVGSIWGSVSKWCVIPDNASNVVVTNGCFRLRMKQGMETYMADLLSYLTTESWRSQARAQARGSDGLAEIPVSAAKGILIPKLENEARSALSDYVNQLIEGRSSIAEETSRLIADGDIRRIDLPPRPSHINLV